MSSESEYTLQYSFVSYPYSTHFTHEVVVKIGFELLHVKCILYFTFTWLDADQQSVAAGL